MHMYTRYVYIYIKLNHYAVHTQHCKSTIPQKQNKTKHNIVNQLYFNSKKKKKKARYSL